jgi:hypothetical protein
LGFPKPGSSLQMSWRCPSPVVRFWGIQRLYPGVYTEPPFAWPPSTCFPGVAPTPPGTHWPWSALCHCGLPAGGEALTPSSAMCLDPTLLQLCPLGSWGRASPQPDDLSDGKGNSQHSFFRRCLPNAGQRGAAAWGFLEQLKASSHLPESSVEKARSPWMKWYCTENGHLLCTRGPRMGRLWGQLREGVRSSPEILS